MLIPTETEGKFSGGPFDVICIQHDVATGRYHAAFYEERPMPGPDVGTPPVLRLKSKMHHTVGAETFDEALAHLDALAEQIELPNDKQVWRREEQLVEVSEAGPDVMAIRPDRVGAVAS